MEEKKIYEESGDDIRVVWGGGDLWEDSAGVGSASRRGRWWRLLLLLLAFFLTKAKKNKKKKEKKEKKKGAKGVYCWVWCMYADVAKLNIILIVVKRG